MCTLISVVIVLALKKELNITKMDKNMQSNQKKGDVMLVKMCTRCSYNTKAYKEQAKKKKRHYDTTKTETGLQ